MTQRRGHAAAEGAAVACKGRYTTLLPDACSLAGGHSRARVKQKNKKIQKCFSRKKNTDVCSQMLDKEKRCFWWVEGGEGLHTYLAVLWCSGT